MDFRNYQQEAAKTDQVTGDSEKSKLVPLLGLAGEVGTLLSEYKKFLRDGSSHERFQDQVKEDLGDLLWYVSNAATKFGLDLEDIAVSNIEKTRSRWPVMSEGAQCSLFEGDPTHLYDYDFPTSEQIPRQFVISFTETIQEDGIHVITSKDGQQIGDALTDNAPDDDGYRFHDVFHLAYAAVLGWSPVIRKLLNVKRRSNSRIDEVEDGARARIKDELISQLVFTYARDHNFLEGTGGVDYHLLKTIHSLVADREVRSRTLAEWERAILNGYAVWRAIRDNRGGSVRVDLLRRKIEILNASKPPDTPPNETAATSESDDY